MAFPWIYKGYSLIAFRYRVLIEVKKAESGHTGGLGRCRIAAVSLPDRCRIAAGSLPPRCRLAAGSAAWRSRGNPETSGGKNLSGFFKSLQKNLATKNNQKFAKSPGMKNRHFQKHQKRTFSIRSFKEVDILRKNPNQKNSNQNSSESKASLRIPPNLSDSLQNRFRILQNLSTNLSNPSEFYVQESICSPLLGCFAGVIYLKGYAPCRRPPSNYYNQYHYYYYYHYCYYD